MAQFEWPGDLAVKGNLSATGTTTGKVVATAGSTFEGAISGASSFSGTSVQASASIGYKTGAGGAVTQETSKATAVAINKICGAITTHNAELAAGAEVTFAVSNTTCAATDVVVACLKSGATTPGTYSVIASEPTDTGFKITISNLSAGALSEALVINFAIIKAVAA